MLNRIINFLNPPKCISCRRQILDQSGLCMACWGEMQFINAPICDITGTALPFANMVDGVETLLSLEALDSPPQYDKARMAVRFSDASRRLIHKLKYQDQAHIAPLMAKMMCRAAADLLGKDAIICPVPLYHWRYFRRRFNQADLLAKQVAKQTAAPYMPRLIKRIKPTKTQVGLTRDERQSNMKNAFRVNSKWLEMARGKAVFVIDDVITTGATVDEIALCLKKAGLGPIYILAFAKVIKAKVI